MAKSVRMSLTFCSTDIRNSLKDGEVHQKKRLRNCNWFLSNVEFLGIHCWWNDEPSYIFIEGQGHPFWIFLEAASLCPPHPHGYTSWSFCSPAWRHKKKDLASRKGERNVLVLTGTIIIAHDDLRACHERPVNTSNPTVECCCVAMGEGDEVKKVKIELKLPSLEMTTLWCTGLLKPAF